MEIKWRKDRKYFFFRPDCDRQPYTSVFLRTFEQWALLLFFKKTYWSKRSGHLCYLCTNGESVWGVEHRTFLPSHVWLIWAEGRKGWNFLKWKIQKRLT